MTESSKSEEQSALALEGIDKRFGTTRALVSASLRVRTGTVHALLGENGAGKSTLMRIAYGMERPDAGTILVHGATARLDSPASAIARGVGMVHQHFTLVPVMTVAENVALGGHGMLDLQQTISGLRELSERTGFALDPEARVELLSVSAQQRVEIATLATLPEAIARAGIRAPAVIVIGETVNLRSALDWLKCAYQ